MARRLRAKRRISGTLPLRRIQSIATAMALLATVASLSIMLAAHVLPFGRLAEKADLLTPFAGHVLVGAVAVAAALYFRQAALLLLLGSVVVALAGHVALVRLKQAQVLWPSGEPRAASDRLRIYELNVWDKNKDLQRLERSIAALDADVVVLVEVDASKFKLIERLKTHYPFQQNCVSQWVCEIAILSKLPILEGRGVRTNQLMPPIVWARVDARSLGMGEVTVVGTHVYRPTRNAWLHAQQMRSLGTVMASAKAPVILAGDLNIGSWSASYARLLEATGLVPTAGLQPTWPAYPVEVPQVSLDHILASPDLVAMRSGLGPATGSDHLPVFAELQRRKAVTAQAPR